MLDWSGVVASCVTAEPTLTEVVMVERVRVMIVEVRHGLTSVN